VFGAPPALDLQVERLPRLQVEDERPEPRDLALAMRETVGDRDALAVDALDVRVVLQTEEHLGLEVNLRTHERGERGIGDVIARQEVAHELRVCEAFLSVKAPDVLRRDLLAGQIERRRLDVDGSQALQRLDHVGHDRTMTDDGAPEHSCDSHDC